jgi:hypothetical protein
LQVQPVHIGSAGLAASVVVQQDLHGTILSAKPTGKLRLGWRYARRDPDGRDEGPCGELGGFAMAREGMRDLTKWLDPEFSVHAPSSLREVATTNRALAEGIIGQKTDVVVFFRPVREVAGVGFLESGVRDIPVFRPGADDQCHKRPRLAHLVRPADSTKRMPAVHCSRCRGVAEHSLQRRGCAARRVHPRVDLRFPSPAGLARYPRV